MAFADIIGTLERWLGITASWIWGLPLLFLLTGGGTFFLIYSRFLPFRYFFHAFTILTGKHESQDSSGQVSHVQALSVALAATIGMGNIAGVAVAIQIGGPGIVFWMWVSAIVGMATKYFTCTLAVMYRRGDDTGRVEGGPMHVIMQGLGSRWRFLALVFCGAGLFGCLPIFNANQLTQATQSILLAPAGISESYGSKIAIGGTLGLLTGIVLCGGLKRISRVVTALVPTMVGLYFFAVSGILIQNLGQLPDCFLLIFSDAFSASHFDGEAIFGGTLAGLMIVGAQRAAFSNEAGIGTAPMAHGDAKTAFPVHEGLVAMLGPVIDTLFVCTLTALAILITGVWESTTEGGINLTASAFNTVYHGFGSYLLLACVLCFGLSSLFSYSYFGTKCFRFLFGDRQASIYYVGYTLSIIAGAISPTLLIVSFVDIMYAIMSIPTILTAILLSPKVIEATQSHFLSKKVL